MVVLYILHFWGIYNPMGYYIFFEKKLQTWDMWTPQDIISNPTLYILETNRALLYYLLVQHLATFSNKKINRNTFSKNQSHVWYLYLLIWRCNKILLLVLCRTSEQGTSGTYNLIFLNFTHWFLFCVFLYVLHIWVEVVKSWLVRSTYWL